MTVRLLLDEHYSEDIAVALRAAGHDVIAAVSDAELRGTSDEELFRHAAAVDRRILTENIEDFRPLLLSAVANGRPAAALLLVPPRRFPRGRGDRTAIIAAAVRAWLDRPDTDRRALEDWLV
jgi:predicted nuclease of predicted toxin-antitoxin system